MVYRNRILCGAVFCVVSLVLLVVFFDSEWIGSVLDHEQEAVRNEKGSGETPVDLEGDCKITPLREVKEVLSLYTNTSGAPMRPMTLKDCEGTKSRRFVPANDPLSRSSRWLLSFPGSGNTWCRLMLEHLTGLHTGTCFRSVLHCTRIWTYRTR